MRHLLFPRGLEMVFIFSISSLAAKFDRVTEEGEKTARMVRFYINFKWHETIAVWVHNIHSNEKREACFRAFAHKRGRVLHDKLSQIGLN